MSELHDAGFLPGAHAIEGYGAGGFRFGGMSHRGSILALPSGIYAWAAEAPADITIESLAPLFAEAPGLIEHLLIGTGLDPAPLSLALRQRLRLAGVSAEPMQTGAAARTYSILLGEKRRVAAALLAVP
ncbi:MAG: Mth938-like domain-containing protein [Methylocella sp.]